MKSLMIDCVDDNPETRPSSEEVDLRVKRMDVKNVDPGIRSSVKASSASLFDIFPRHIAEALRDGRTTEPDHRDSVTIFFSDIVGFTKMSATLEARKVAQMLDRLYTKFDKLSRRHDIFKVETIGDAYMAVTNLVKEQDGDHAKRIAMFAIDALMAANDTLIDEDDPGKGVVNIRVGFHSGSVVADVVGTRSPRYCLFGDTVNTASRMESNSEMNRINCSVAAARLLYKQWPDLPLVSRGKIEVKGKGEMHMYWVNEGEEVSSRRSSFFGLGVSGREESYLGMIAVDPIVEDEKSEGGPEDDIEAPPESSVPLIEKKKPSKAAQFGFGSPLDNVAELLESIAEESESPVAQEKIPEMAPPKNYDKTNDLFDDEVSV